MRFASFSVVVLLALTAVSCSGGQTPVAPTAAAPTDTQVPPTDTPEVSLPTDTPSGPLGSISGKILPPPVEQPATVLRIFAREINLGKVYSVDVDVHAETYTLPNVPMGKYYVFGWFYPDGIAGAYTDSGVDTVQTSADQLKCGNSLVEVVLTERKPDYQGADIACWAGDYFIYITPTP